MSEHPVQDFIHQAQEQIHHAQEQIHEQLSQASILGTPMDFRGKTLIPVANKPSFLETFKRGKNASGKTLGFLELGEGKTRFVKIEDNRWLIWGLVLAVFAFLLFFVGMGLRKKKVRKARPSLW